MASWFKRLKSALTKSSNAMAGGITDILVKRWLDADTLEELEDHLISHDLGIGPSILIIEALTKGRHNREISDQEVREILAQELASILEPAEKPLHIIAGNRPHVILMVGVNGTGKTTTIGKLAKQFKDQGKSVMLAAGDTFRAAAVDQLEVWAERAGVPIVSSRSATDSASLAFEAMDRAQREDCDILIIDTAGRLQNRKELMDELQKVIRVISKKDETAPHDTVLVLDATTGQNALLQVEVFQAVAQVSGIIMTKLDGSARGGVLVACVDKFGLPVHAIGIGEAVDDLRPFSALAFAQALAGLEDTPK